MYGDQRDLHRVDRRQRQMCIRDVYGAVKDLDRLPAGPAVVSFFEWKVDLIDLDSSDLHVGRVSGWAKVAQVRASVSGRGL